MPDKDKIDEAEDISIEIISDEEDEAVAASPREVKSKSAMRKEAEADDLQQTMELAWAAMETQLAQIKRENSSLKDQLLRKQAEFENYRKRTEREKQDARQSGRTAVLLEMLAVLDNFERALVSVTNAAGKAGQKETGKEAKRSAEDEALRQGFELIYKQFKDALTKLGVEPVEAIGKTFDPHLHEAVTIEESAEHEANTVIAEFQKGYKLGEQLLRPAQVKVAATPGE